MVEAFSLRTAHFYGDALASQARLRFKVFVEQRGLDHAFYDEMEYDEFDSPGAVYFVWRDEAYVVRGLVRLLPTTLPYMLEQYWPHLIQNGQLPHGRHIWEMTRVCVDRTFAPSVRTRILPELLCALHEFCAENAIESVIGVTRPHLINYFLRTGVTWLGNVDLIEGEQEAAFHVSAEHLRPAYHCEKLNLGGPLLLREPASARRIAA